MAKTISKLNIQVALSSKGLRSGVSSAAKSLGGLTSKLGPVGVALGAVVGVAAAAGGAMRGLASAFREVDEAAKASARLGTTIASLKGLQLAAERGGSSAAVLTSSLERMNNRISEAAQGSGEAQDALKELGLSAANLGSLTADQKMLAIAQALEGVESQGDKTRIAIDIFGRQGVQLLNTLESLAESGMKPLQDEMRELGVLSAADAKGIEEMNDSWGEFKAAIQGISNQVAASLAPVLTDLLQHVLIPMAKNLVIIAKKIREAFGADLQNISGAGEEAKKAAEAAAAATSKWAEEQKVLKELGKGILADEKALAKTREDRLRSLKTELASLERIRSVVASTTPTSGAVAGGTTAGFNAVQRMVTSGRDAHAEDRRERRELIASARKRERILAEMLRLGKDSPKEIVKVTAHKIVG